MKWETVAIAAAVLVVVWYVAQSNKPAAQPVGNSGLQPIAPTTSNGIAVEVTAPLF
jgi:hypothetical protein